MKKIAVINEFSIETIRDALQKLDSFEGLVVNGLNAFQLNEVEKIDPELFAQISEKINSGKWYPFVGMWSETDKEISDEFLTRSVLYSIRFFKDRFDRKFRIFVADKIYTNLLPQVVYTAGFDSCYIKEEAESFWLDGADGTRTHIAGKLETVDVNDIDDGFINENEFASIEDEIIARFSVPMDVKTVKLSYKESCPTDEEKMLVEAEKISVQSGEKNEEKIKELWLEIFLGNSVKNEAEKIINGRKICEDFLTINSDGAKLISMKYAEDGSDNVVIRIRETEGKEKTLFVMCDALEAGFRCEINPYELITFRIIEEGFVQEIFLGE